MSPMSRSLVLCSLLAAVPAAATGCSDDGADDDGTTYNCEADDRDEPFTAGMQKTGAGGTLFTLVSSDPSPPGRDDNTWVLQIGPAGTPFDGTVKVTPFMPDHRHGTPINAVVEPLTGAPGQFTAAPVNLWMPGLWEITVEATPTGGTRDSVVFRFCITG